MTRHLTFFTAVFVYKSINSHLYYVGYFASNLNSPYLNRYHSHLQPQSFRNLKLMESTDASVLSEIPVEFRKKNKRYILFSLTCGNSFDPTQLLNLISIV